MNGVLNTLSGAVLSGTLTTEEKELDASISLHYGADGKPGEDGFSPTITIHENTETTYILKVTDVNGTYLTPNLKCYGAYDGDGNLITGEKVDEDLKKYEAIDPTTLTVGQRDSSFLYVGRSDKDRQNNKISLSSVALVKETDDKIRRKLQTKNSLDEDTDWKVGDYIFLEVI